MSLKIPTEFENLNTYINSKDVESFLMSSKTCKKENFIYFARYGNTFNGHKLALKVIRSQNLIVGEISQIKAFYTKNSEQKEILNSKYFINTESVEQSVKEHFKKILNGLNYFPKSIAVTGTSGKTSVVQLTGQVLNQLNHNKTLKIGTLGIEIGLDKLPNTHQTTPDYPGFVQALQNGNTNSLSHLIMEVSSHGLAENRIFDFQFDIAVFTNFSQDHLDFHKTMKEYLEAKLLLFSDHLKEDGTCIISTQSPEWLDVIAAAAHSSRTLYLLVHEEHLDFCLQAQPFLSHFKKSYFLMLSEKNSTLRGLSGKLHLLDHQQNLLNHYEIKTPLIGEFNFENLMATFCICHALEYNPKDFLSNFSTIKGTPGRMEAIELNSCETNYNPSVIVDYSHKPGALESTLKTLKKLLQPSRKLISVFGCGGDRDASKRPLMGQIGAQLSDVVILTSDNPRTEDPQKIIDDIKLGITPHTEMYEFTDRRKAIEKAFQIANCGDIILIAGKGHETLQIIGTEKKEFSDLEVAKSFISFSQQS